MVIAFRPITTNGNAKRRKPEPKVIDLMEALQASVDQAKKGGAKGASGRKRAKRRPAA